MQIGHFAVWGEGWHGQAALLSKRQPLGIASGCRDAARQPLSVSACDGRPQRYCPGSAFADIPCRCVAGQPAMHIYQATVEMT